MDNDVVLWIVVATALAFDFTNGFHDTANAVATSISTRAMAPRVAVSLAAILLAGSFSRVGAQPILTDMEAPREEAGAWNDAFEVGSVLVFATTTERRRLALAKGIPAGDQAEQGSR